MHRHIIFGFVFMCLSSAFAQQGPCLEDNQLPFSSLGSSVLNQLYIKNNLFKKNFAEELEGYYIHMSPPVSGEGNSIEPFVMVNNRPASQVCLDKEFAQALKDYAKVLSSTRSKKVVRPMTPNLFDCWD